MQAKTYAHDDLIVVVLRGMGLTHLEKTMMDSGDPDRVDITLETFFLDRPLEAFGAVEIINPE